MARVVLSTDVANQFTDQVTEFEAEGATVRALYRALDKSHPGLGTFLEESTFVVINGEMVQDAFLEPLEDDSEVVFVPKIKGG